MKPFCNCLSRIKRCKWRMLYYMGKWNIRMHSRVATMHPHRQSLLLGCFSSHRSCIFGHCCTVYQWYLCLQTSKYHRAHTSLKILCWFLSCSVSNDHVIRAFSRDLLFYRFAKTLLLCYTITAFCSVGIPTDFHFDRQEEWTNSIFSNCLWFCLANCF